MNEGAAHRAALRLTQGEAVESLPADAEALRRWLTARVGQMLRTNPALLMSHLYRVDVRERDVQAALSSANPAEALADALITREIEKSRYRERYADPDDATL